jgi:hypothetical protein
MLERATLSSVMAGPAEGLVPAIHVFTALQLSKGVDGRDKPGHDAVVRGPE